MILKRSWGFRIQRKPHLQKACILPNRRSVMDRAMCPENSQGFAAMASISTMAPLGRSLTA